MGVLCTRHRGTQHNIICGELVNSSAEQLYRAHTHEHFGARWNEHVRELCLTPDTAFRRMPGGL